MFLSMLELSINDCRALDIKDAYSIHKAVYTLFPQIEGDTRDFLFADKGGDARGRKIIILSERRPIQPEHGNLLTKPVPDAFLGWDSYAFEIILNPVKRDSKSRSLVPIHKDDLSEWFSNKAPSFGLEIIKETLTVQINSVQRFIKDNAEVIHSSATFTGQLKVIDRPMFIKSFSEGIGRAKGFGFGLLQLMPIKQNNA